MKEASELVREMVIVAAETQGDLVYFVGICRGNQSDGEKEVKMEAVRAMVVSNVDDTVAASTPAPRRWSTSWEWAPDQKRPGRDIRAKPSNPRFLSARQP